MIWKENASALWSSQTTRPRELVRKRCGERAKSRILEAFREVRSITRREKRPPPAGFVNYGHQARSTEAVRWRLLFFCGAFGRVGICRHWHWPLIAEGRPPRERSVSRFSHPTRNPCDNFPGSSLPAKSGKAEASVDGAAPRPWSIEGSRHGAISL